MTAPTRRAAPSPLPLLLLDDRASSGYALRPTASGSSSQQSGLSVEPALTSLLMSPRCTSTVYVGEVVYAKVWKNRMPLGN